jgi:hyperosmotically inducible protein
VEEIPMNRKAAMLLVLAPFVLVVGCNRDNNPVDTTHVTGGNTPAAPAPPAAGNDNSARNAHDQAGGATPLDQGNNQADLETTQQIRKAIMADDSLSNDAKNVKIITSGGIVTLRGPVRSETERANIELKARKAAGTERVVDELEIANK